MRLEVTTTRNKKKVEAIAIGLEATTTRNKKQIGGGHRY